jgi:hypothetical protein
LKEIAMSRVIAFAALLALLLLPALAEARPVHFLGPHPIATKYGGGYCYLEGPHMHVYAPDHPQLYQEVGGELVFAADPTPFGYDGPHSTFYGHHPIPGMPGVYCYLDGPHMHAFPPSDGPDYRMEGDVAFYVGPFAPDYERERAHRARQYTAVYRPYAAQRPVVQVTPPPEWHGEVWVAPPGVPSVEVRAGVPMPPVGPAATVEVRGPGVLPPPSVHVYAPAPPRVEVVAPPMPRAHVEVYAPAPPRARVQVVTPGVVVAPPPAVVVAPAPVYVEQGVVYEHDHGKHKGWYKRGGDHDHEGDHGKHGRHW